MVKVLDYKVNTLKEFRGSRVNEYIGHIMF